ncbi:MAG: DUF4191 family protein [Egibacteraceae bacterium]
MAKLSERFAQTREGFTRTRAADPRFLQLFIGIPLVVLVLNLGLGLATGKLGLTLSVGIPAALLAALLVFGWRAQTAAITQIEGQPGAAAAVLQAMRGPWRTIPGVAATRKAEFVHLVIGRPGVVLVGEGGRARVAVLLKQERRRVVRAAGETPVHEVSVGDAEGQEPLRQLQGHVQRLPRAIKAREVGDLETRLSALRSAAPPIPKGPIPKAPRRR